MLLEYFFINKKPYIGHHNYTIDNYIMTLIDFYTNFYYKRIKFLIQINNTMYLFD